MNSQYRKNLKALAESCKKYIDEQLNGGNKMILEVASITGLTNSQCQDLSCGDVIVENNNGVKTTYIVFSKTTTTMSLTYVDSANSKEVKYEVSNNAWAYSKTTNVKNLYHHIITISGYDPQFEGQETMYVTIDLVCEVPKFSNFAQLRSYLDNLHDNWWTGNDGMIPVNGFLKAENEDGALLLMGSLDSDLEFIYASHYPTQLKNSSNQNTMCFTNAFKDMWFSPEGVGESDEPAGFYDYVK